MQSLVEGYYRLDTGSNYCKKVKETLVEKLECEGRDEFLHKNLKKAQAF